MFTFTVANAPAVKFTFDSSNSWKTRPLKRRRPLWDVDGNPEPGKKKRRLRLHLITSRLSRPFSYPATNIVDRGPSAIRLWAKKRAREKNELRKAAIMNNVRIQLHNLKAKNNAPVPATTFVPPRPTHSQIVSQLALRDILAAKFNAESEPLPPSPLGVSNYDALDMDMEDTFNSRSYDDDDDDDDDDEDDGDSNMNAEKMATYCDFNIIDYSVNSCLADNYDYLDEMDGIPMEVLEGEDQPPVMAMDVDKQMLNVLEREVQLEVAAF
jgi:hypothetical protein